MFFKTKYISLTFAVLFVSKLIQYLCWKNNNKKYCVSGNTQSEKWFPRLIIAIFTFKTFYGVFLSENHTGEALTTSMTQANQACSTASIYSLLFASRDDCLYGVLLTREMGDDYLSLWSPSISRLVCPSPYQLAFSPWVTTTTCVTWQRGGFTKLDNSLLPFGTCQGGLEQWWWHNARCRVPSQWCSVSAEVGWSDLPGWHAAIIPLNDMETTTLTEGLSGVMWHTRYSQ